MENEIEVEMKNDDEKTRKGKRIKEGDNMKQKKRGGGEQKEMNEKENRKHDHMARQAAENTKAYSIWEYSHSYFISKIHLLEGTLASLTGRLYQSICSSARLLQGRLLVEAQPLKLVFISIRFR